MNQLELAISAAPLDDRPHPMRWSLSGIGRYDPYAAALFLSRRLIEGRYQLGYFADIGGRSIAVVAEFIYGRGLNRAFNPHLMIDQVRNPDGKVELAITPLSQEAKDHATPAAIDTLVRSYFWK